MIKHPVRKFFGLTVLYIVIILGIFLLQFRSDSPVSATFGALRLQLTESAAPGQQTSEAGTPRPEKELRNRFQVSFRGLILSADSSSPVKLTAADGTETDGILTGWSKDSDLGFTLTFNDDVSVSLTVSDGTGDASLLIQADLPGQIESLSIPYKPAGGHLVTEQTERRTIISSKSQQFEAEAAKLTPDRLVLTRKNALAKYSVFDPAKVFDFGSVHGIAAATKEAYDATLRQLKDDIIRLFNPAAAESMPEQTIVAYVAAMAENGGYDTALSQLPSAVKTSPRRSYLSAPYFNSLVSLNRSLVMFVENGQEMIDNAAGQLSLEIFTLRDLAELLCITDRNSAYNLVSFPALSASFAPTTAQAAGILRTYTRLAVLDAELAAQIHPVLSVCLETIAAACSLDGEAVTLAEDGTPLSVMDAASAGAALVDYGRLTGNQDYSAAGYLVVNSYVKPTDNLRTAAELYPVLVTGNTFYPHIELVANASESGTGKTVWAWTAAKSIVYKRDSEDNLTLSIDFPQGSTQHIIINGIEPFRRIDIYDIAFRTDPRFESYNSSGYVYNGDTGTMFLKSLHRSAVENVKLYYDNPEAQARQAEAGQAQPEEQDGGRPEQGGGTGTAATVPAEQPSPAQGSAAGTI